MRRTTIILADDHRLICEALKLLLEPTYEVVAIVEDGRTAVSAAQRLKPDVVVLDIAMPGLNGLDAGRQIIKELPRTKVLVLTMNTESRLLAEALRSGFSGYILKHSAASELLQAVQEALRGGKYVSRGMKAADALLRHPSADQDRLSPRQREVVQLVAEGHSMKEIAEILHISARTVEDHKYTAMELLKLKTNAELIQYAVRERLVKA